MIRWLPCFALLMLCAGIALSQASDNAVNQVAQRMYCPICENIPLDECMTGACLEWKDEIRAQLAAGKSESAIIDSFVARFGDHVVGVPQDPILRILTIVMPLLGTALALGIGWKTFRSFSHAKPQPPTQTSERSDESYRRQLEADVRARR